MKHAAVNAKESEVVSWDVVRTPCYIIDEDRIEKNLRILKGVMDRTGCRILLAQKAFSSYAVYPLIAEYLRGATASGLYEAKLCHEKMPSQMENHIFSPAYREEDMEEILSICDHIVFNSMRQLVLYGPRAKAAGLQVGLRINPECSTQEDHAIYDPCAPGSRLGVTLAEFQVALAGDVEQEVNRVSVLELLDGLHFHTLCEQNSDALAVTLLAVEEKFGKYLPQMKWLNFGGGHHITRDDYDMETLEACIQYMADTYGLQIYLEPGEAIALNGGSLVSSVLEVQSDKVLETQPQSVSQIVTEANPINVILDTSAACHMPDVLEMPYRPPLQDSGAEGEKTYTYRLGGPTCLAGDIIGTYSFDQPLREGDRLVFEDMAIYSMVKNNTFNGMPLPDIYLKKGDECRLWKRFGYEDFVGRL